MQFNSLTNYLADQWTPTAGCQSCKEDTIDLEGIKVGTDQLQSIDIDNLLMVKSDLFAYTKDIQYNGKVFFAGTFDNQQSTWINFRIDLNL